MPKVKKLETIKRLSVPILRHNDVVKAGVFGSIVKGKLSKKSDIDFLIQFKPGKSLLDLSRLKLQLENKLQRDVDLVTYRSIHPLLKQRILEEEVRIL